MLLLTVRGRRSGTLRTLPLLYFADGDRLVVVASKGGHPRHPAWFLNLVAHPDVEVELARARERRRARVATPEERARLWPRAVGLYASYAAYQARTTRRSRSSSSSRADRRPRGLGSPPPLDPIRPGRYSAATSTQQRSALPGRTEMVVE